MPPRRSHKKSRAGCNTCRTRRVKCDEQRPVCQNCARRETECVYHVPDNQLRFVVFTPQLPSPPSTAASTPSPSPSPSPSSALVLSPPIPHPELNIDSLTLLHHYITSEDISFSHDATVASAWQSRVSRLALTRPYLMHLILSISALHLGHLQPSSAPRYLLTAATHFDSASGGFQRALELQDSADDADINALFAGSGLVLFYIVLTAPRLYPYPRCTTWFPLMCGIRSILGAKWKVLKSGELSAIVQAKGLLPYIIPAGFPNLPDYIFELGSGDDEDSKIYRRAVELLEETREVDHATAGIFLWPGRVPQEFLTFVGERRQRALVLLAHYCALFWTPVTDWWIKDQVEDELRAIEACLDDGWKSRGVMDWPWAVVASRAKSNMLM